MGVERHLLADSVILAGSQPVQILLRRMLMLRDVSLSLIIVHTKAFVKSIGVGLPIVGRGTGYFRHIIGHGTITMKGRFQTIIHGFPNLFGTQIRTFQRFRTDDASSSFNSRSVAFFGVCGLPATAPRTFQDSSDESTSNVRASSVLRATALRIWGL